MSGIYTPILSIFTLLVLVIQVRLQNQSVTHERDQSYIQEARSDIEYYLAQIDLELDKTLKKDATVRKFLNEGFSYADIDSLKSKELLKIAQEFNRQFPRSSAIWSAYYSILAGLGSQQHFPYKHNFEAAKQKAISMLSYEICVALDNYIWCLSEGRLNFLYQFSSEQSV